MGKGYHLFEEVFYLLYYLGRPNRGKIYHSIHVKRDKHIFYLNLFGIRFIVLI